MGIIIIIEVGEEDNNNGDVGGRRMSGYTYHLRSVNCLSRRRSNDARPMSWTMEQSLLLLARLVLLLLHQYISNVKHGTI
jgi:hypothetical protein